MILLKFLHLFLLASTVNCSTYWIFKWSIITPPAKDNVIIEELGSDDSAKVVPVKPVVVLSEYEDEEKKQFYNDMLAQSRRKNDLAAASRARYLAALPKEHDSMEMISAETSLANQLMAFAVKQKERIGKIWNRVKVKDIKYGHSQYSDSEADEGYVVEEPKSSSTSSSSESEDVDEEAYLRYIIGEPIEKSEAVKSEPVKSESDLVDDDEENFEVIENPDESMNTLF